MDCKVRKVHKDCKVHKGYNKGHKVRKGYNKGHKDRKDRKGYKDCKAHNIWVLFWGNVSCL